MKSCAQRLLLGGILLAFAASSNAAVSNEIDLFVDVADSMSWRQENGGLVLSVPPVVPTELPGSAAWTLRIEMEDGMK